MIKLTTILLIILSGVFAQTCYALPTHGIIQQVVDGDTFRAFIDGKTFAVRLLCIDTPEKIENPKLIKDAQRSGSSRASLMEAGKQSTTFLRSILKQGDSVNFEYGPEQYDHYGRVLAYVYLKDGTFLNRLIVSKGYAGIMCFHPNDSHAQGLLDEALKAKKQGIGLWGKAIELPLYWKRKKLKSSKNPPK